MAVRCGTGRTGPGSFGSRAARGGPGGTGVAEADEFVVPAVPDYVDGSFRVRPADEEAARVPTSGRAA